MRTIVVPSYHGTPNGDLRSESVIDACRTIIESAGTPIQHTPAGVYLGDGVYVDVDPNGDPQSIVLTTENGVIVSNRIVLDINVINALEIWVKRWRGLP